MSKKKKIINDNSFWLNRNNLDYIENIYLNYLNNKNSIHNSWHKIFTESSMDIPNFSSQITNKDLSYLKYFNSNLSKKITELVTSFRLYGYKSANTNPLKLYQEKKSINLELSTYDFSEIELDQKINYNDYIHCNIVDNIFNFHKKLTSIYCKKIGFEYMHIENKKEKKWLQKIIENEKQACILNTNEKKHIFKKLLQAESFEKFLSQTFPNTKRFSLEGCEILVPMLDEICQSTKNNEINEIIFGMAHRGRLNILVNILGKKYKDLFNEFHHNYHDTKKSGDVKYHMGFESIINIDSNKQLKLSLKFNPSHLEIIHPVVMGSVRAENDNKTIKNCNTILPIAIHGDAAITGQGVIQEMLNMSQTKAYNVGGTIHIIINNQIGFTTSNKIDLRSSNYCSDIAKIIECPIFHVNADDPESAIFSIRLAIKFRLIFKKDVFINLVCYRRHGHNEVDDPLVTQPVMYKKIKLQKTITKLFFKKLVKENIFHENYKSELNDTYQEIFKCEYNKYLKNIIDLKHENIPKKKILIEDKKNIFIPLDELKKLAISINQLPNFINVHYRIKKIYQDRIEMALEKKLFDWGAAENLAYATILKTGISCRISGEDTCRGTFFHRHSVIYDQTNNSTYIPLKYINKDQVDFNIYNSVLSEEATLAFEYGYSINKKKTITIWEAQFGDFVNVAQVVIDQFISSGEQKWGIGSNLTLFLPHGYEGQGPEHSSARIERFLQLCAENNMKICIPTTSGQMYHLLRKQAFQKFKKPLIIITPKILLRYQPSCSSLNELTYGTFDKVLNKNNYIINQNNIQRIIFCTGKIYYDLYEKIEEKNKDNIVIIRIEQLYPFPIKEIKKIILLYNSLKDFIWCQEEPKNQGAWQFIKNYLHKVIPINSKLCYVGRPNSASTATGYMYIHRKQQKKIIHDALNIKIIKEESK